MSRRYPIEPVQEPVGTRARTSQREPLTLRSARVVAGWLVGVRGWRLRHVDLSAAVSGLVLLALGIAITVGALGADTYLHRGVEEGDEEPFVVQPTGDVLASNADLRVYADGDLTPVSNALERGGFQYVRQPFLWSEIQPAPDQFDWTAYDRIVEELSRRDIGLVAVILGAPQWARDPSTLGAPDGPPVDPSSLGAFTQALTDRYGETVPFVQIWDQPNAPDRWGGTPATGSTFLPYLAAGYNGALAGYAEVQVLTPELLPIVPDGGPTDLEFFDQLYLAGGGPFFDVAALRLDGGSTSPDDRRVGADRQNISRAVLLRELMVGQGDGETPVWATSFGWARNDTTSEQEQAEFVIRAIERSWAEWPWLGPMFQWSFLSSSGGEGYSLVREDGTATELYQRLAVLPAASDAVHAQTGFTPMDGRMVAYTGAWQDQHLEGRTFRTSGQLDSGVTLRFIGSGVAAVIRIGPESGNVIVEIDGRVVPGGGGDDGDEWEMDAFQTLDVPIDLADGLEYGEHTLTIRLASEGTITLGGLIVERDQPFVWPIILLTIGALVALVFGVRSLCVLVARRSGHLPRPGEEAAPSLPRMPDWRPGRRA